MRGEASNLCGASPLAAFLRRSRRPLVQRQREEDEPLNKPRRKKSRPKGIAHPPASVPMPGTGRSGHAAPLSPHLALGVRLALATVGAYAVCYTATGALAFLLPLRADESVTVAGLLTPLWAVGGVLAAFCIRSVKHATLGMGGLAACALLITSISGPG